MYTRKPGFSCFVLFKQVLLLNKFHSQFPKFFIFSQKAFRFCTFCFKVTKNAIFPLFSCRGQRKKWEMSKVPISTLTNNKWENMKNMYHRFKIYIKITAKQKNKIQKEQVSYQNTFNFAYSILMGYIHYI